MAQDSSPIRRQDAADGVSLKVPCDVANLRYIRAVVADLARKMNFSTNDIAQIEIAVDEACANIVEHAYDKNKEWCWHSSPEIRLDIRLTEDRFIIEINDHGGQFDFASYRPIDIEEHLRMGRRRGLGIFIMRKFMDEIQYNSSKATGNTLRMVKHLKKS
jgi:serine/threonine-protein kinase RsbW